MSLFDSMQSDLGKEQFIEDYAKGIPGNEHT